MCPLQLAPAARLLDAALHRSCHLVGVKDGASAQVSGRPAHRLNQRAVAAQKSFLVGVENRHQRDFRQVQSFAQQVDSDQHIELAEAQSAHDLHPLDRIDVGVHVAHANSHLLQVVGEIFRHALGQRRDEHPLSSALADSDLVQQIVYLTTNRADLDLRIDQTRRANDLLDHRSFRQPQLDLRRRRTDVERPRRQREKLVEHQRAIVQGAWQAESVIHQRQLARTVAVEHPADLRQRHV